jgi:hypothetical protein
MVKGMHTETIMISLISIEISGLFSRVKGNLGRNPRECAPQRIQLIKGEGPKEPNCMKCGTPTKKDKNYCPCCGKKYSGHDDIFVEWD